MHLFDTLSFLAASAPLEIEVCPPRPFEFLCAIKLWQAIPGLITFLLVAAFITALGFLTWGGVRFITSGGDKATLDGARVTIVAAISGLLLIFVSFFIMNYITQTFFNKRFNQIIEIPSVRFNNPF